MTAEQQIRFVEALRALGIKSAVMDGERITSLEFFSASVPVDTSPQVPNNFGKAFEPEKCRCGHEETAHDGEGYCLRGCPVSNCFEPERK